MKKRRWHLTQNEIAEIRRLTQQGVHQSEIARRLNIGRDTVGIWQVKMGLPTRLTTPTPEDEIMRLFRAGVGGYEISRRLRCPANRVWAVMHKHKFQRADKLGIATPQENIDRFIEALKRKDDYVKRLAKKYNVGLCKANRIAHEILGTYRFRPGVAKPPLSSDFPQRPKGTSTDAMAAELAERISMEIFGGSLPSGSSRAIADAIATTCIPPGTDERVRREYLAALVPALEACCIAQQNKWPN